MLVCLPRGTSAHRSHLSCELIGVVSNNTTDRMLEHMTYLCLKVFPVIGIMELFSQQQGTVKLV